jgi:hypothetical protein
MKTAPRPRKKPQGKVTKIGMKDLPAFAARLARCSSPDPYLVSASYYGFTGRHGLWIYEEGADFIPFCLHPNVPGQTLIFPSVSRNGLALAKNLIESHFSPEDDIRFARLSPRDAEEVVTHLSWTTKGRRYEVVEEHVLDWLFPVHTLSTGLVSERKGGAFENFRNCTHRVDRARIRVEPLDIRAHYFDLMALSLRWAKDRACARYSVSDLFDPHAAVIRMIRESGLDTGGSVVFMDDVCVSFAVWERPADKSLPASSVALLSHGPSRGLPEFQQFEMSRALRAEGIGRVCIGGSETVGLDTYKRKMNPVESLPLVSVAAIVEAAGARATMF